jgi:DNA (cytosine-5)-methyltransferase 1
VPSSAPKPPEWDALCGTWQGERPGIGRKVLSLYSGAGGLDRGFLDAGFEITHAIESDAHAVATYRANVGDHVICEKLPAALKALPNPASRPFDVVIGGPPCQGFSVMGLMDPNDPRSRHVHVFLDAVRVYRPAAFCMENVKALAAGGRWEGVFKGLVARAQVLGYTVTPVVLNAADYTVPQARERLFLIGVRDGFPVVPVPVTSTRPMTVLEAFARLPAFGQPGNDSKCSARVVLAKKPVMRASPYKGSLLFNGSGRPLDLNAVARTLPASMGGNGTPIVDREELEQRLKDPKSAVTSWVVRHHARLAAGKANLKGPHPLRRITVEEAAELQGFPQGWRWVGARNAQYRMIGNAVPPRLARYVAISVGHALLSRETWLPTEPAALAPRRISATPRSIAQRRHAVAA